MRYQLRYIRELRARSSPVARDDTSRLARTPQIPVVNRARQPGHRRVLTFDLGVTEIVLPPVPWLSGRASASHAEGRWFDPSRDHHVDVGVSREPH
jgi:hypothetical protein